MDKGRERGREVVRKGFFQQTMEGWVMESVRGGARKWSETSILSSQGKGGVMDKRKEMGREGVRKCLFQGEG